MKRILIVLLVVGLFQAVSAFAQDGGRKHGGNRDEGGFNNSNPSGPERMGNQKVAEEKPQLKDEPQKEKAQRNVGSKPGQQKSQKQRNLNNANRGSNSAPNWQGN